MSRRIPVTIMSLSAAALIGLFAHEGYSDKAIIPTKGDVPTIGFGSTVFEDGSRVRLGDTITPERAVRLAYSHTAKDEAAFKKTLPGVELTQGEYDVYIDFMYQYGQSNWEKSSMRRHLLKGEHKQACDALLRYRYAAGYDCSTPGNKRCWGVWERQLKRHAQCTGAN